MHKLVNGLLTDFDPEHDERDRRILYEITGFQFHSGDRFNEDSFYSDVKGIEKPSAGSLNIQERQEGQESDEEDSNKAPLMIGK